MSIVSFNEAKQRLSGAIREESYIVSRGEREIEWRDPDTHELIAEGCCGPEGSEVNFNQEEGVSFFDGRQGEELVALGENTSVSQDFIDTDALPGELFVPLKARAPARKRA